MNHLNVILRLCQRPLSPGTASPAETPKSHAAFLAYIALGARRSVREAARQAHQGSIKTVSSSTIVSRWLGWSAKHKWVSRADARDKWIARASDEQLIVNILACKLARRSLRRPPDGRFAL